MKMINKELADSAEKYWRRATLTPILTFLSSKFADVNTTNDIHVGKDEDEKFLREFLVKNSKYFNPCTNKYPKNQKEYHKTIAQYRYKWEMDYSQAFADGLNYGYYKFSKDYINVTKESVLKNYYDRLSLFNVVIWLYRDCKFQQSDNITFLKDKFISDFHLTRDELSELFNDDFENDVDVFKICIDSIIKEAIDLTDSFKNKIENIHGGESQDHINLKNYVANNPESIGLPEDSLAFIEYKFPTGDRVDIAFDSKNKNWAVVEIELEGMVQNLIGLFQAVKYKALQKAIFKSKEIEKEVNGYLVAFSIPTDITVIAKKLNIKTVEIPKLNTGK